MIIILLCVVVPITEGMIQEWREKESQIINKSKPDEGLFISTNVGSARPTVLVSHEK